jgi:hypothetical protein
MNKTLLFFLFISTLAFGGQGRGHARSGSAPGAQHSNAPIGTPVASSDREKGTQRAKDVGRGKKKGLSNKEVKPKRHRR